MKMGTLAMGIENRVFISVFALNSIFKSAIHGKIPQINIKKVSSLLPPAFCHLPFSS
jgi:hypothetical protein